MTWQKVLAIDYGQKRVGLALATGPVVETKGFLENSSWRSLFSELVEICREQKVEQVLLGLPQGSLEPEIRKFAKQLQKMLKLKVVLTDETLSSHQAEQMIGYRDRKRIDSFSAAIILKQYLDLQESI
ncbi:MAG: Holliday junction resolvase RuvX [Patescibacteria group bacterium]